MISKIGIENFRIFKNYTEFELAPITVLTGPNNSGKSSFIKFLLLLKEGIDNLNFEQGKLHNLKSFDNVLNRENKSDGLRELRFTFNLGEHFEALFTYKNGKLTNIKLYENKTLLFEYSNKEDSIDGNGFSKYDGYQLIKNFNIDYLIDKIYDIDVQNLSFFELQSSLYGWEIENIKQEYYTKELLIKSYKALQKASLNLNKDSLLFELHINEFNVTEENKEELLTQQKKYFKSIKTHFDPLAKTNFHSIFKKLKSNLVNLKNENNQVILKYFKEKFKNNEVKIKFSPLGKFIFQQKFQTGSLNTTTGEKESVNWFDTILLNKVNQLGFNLNNLHYISANRGSQKRILTNKSENDIDEIILEFKKSNNQHEEFINKSFDILGIKGVLDVKRHENVISVVKIINGDKEISLADLGYGYSQIIPVILKISNIYSNYNDSFPMDFFENTLILEEPEANLHPNLQSKLADVLVLAHKTFGIHFIIETHSEYLIRKLQYLTAQKELKKDDVVIYYFNADEYVNNKEPKVKEIKINETGGLTDTFGPGFFDESTSLKFELMKLNQAQKN